MINHYSIQSGSLTNDRSIQASKSMGIKPLSLISITVSINFQFHLTQNTPDTEYICMPTDCAAKGWNVFLKDVC